MGCNRKSSSSKKHSSKHHSIPNMSSFTTTSNTSTSNASTSNTCSTSNTSTSVSNSNKKCSCSSTNSYTTWSGCKSSSSSSSFECGCKYEKVYPKKCCDSNPLYSLTPAQLDRVNLMSKQFVNPNGTSSGNMLSQGYGIIPGIATPTIFSTQINY
jgi:hypothetical protein